MKKRLNLRSIFIGLVALIVVVGASSCSKELVHPNQLSADRLVSGRIDGTWANPRDIVTPANVPAEVFGTMRLVFTTDEEGKPISFIAQDCPIIFSNTTTGNWSVTGKEDDANVKLTGVSPVDDFNVKVSSNSMTISFYMGWENTDTKATGKGDFKVTLDRK